MHTHFVFSGLVLLLRVGTSGLSIEIFALLASMAGKSCFVLRVFAQLTHILLCDLPLSHVSPAVVV